MTFLVTATGSATALPSVGSGTLQLWLRADAGVVTNSAGLVSQWNDQSGNANSAAQTNSNFEPALVSATGLSGKSAVRFNGIQNSFNGSETQMRVFPCPAEKAAGQVWMFHRCRTRHSVH